MTDDELVGRAGLVERAKKQLETSGSVLLYGPTGIGKSAIGRALVAERTRAGCRVLSAAPSQSEAGLPYVTLLDLLSNQLELAWQVLPDHLRQPLEVALLKASAPDTVRDELAVRLAVLHVLRRLAATGPGPARRGRHPVGGPVEPRSAHASAPAGCPKACTCSPPSRWPTATCR